MKAIPNSHYVKQFAVHIFLLDSMFCDIYIYIYIYMYIYMYGFNPPSSHIVCGISGVKRNGFIHTLLSWRMSYPDMPLKTSNLWNSDWLYCKVSFWFTANGKSSWIFLLNHLFYTIQCGCYFGISRWRPQKWILRAETIAREIEHTNKNMAPLMKIHPLHHIMAVRTLILTRAHYWWLSRRSAI